MSADAHRWGSAVAVAVVVVAFLAGLPLLELATTPEPARPGDDLPWNDRLSRAAVGTVTIEPAAGWTVATTGDGTPGLRNGAATFVVQRQVGDGCSAAEAAAVADLRDGEPAVPAAGRPYLAGAIPGTVRTWWGADSEGVAFTGCIEDTALTVVVRGPTGSLSGDRYAEVAAMLDSLEVR